MRFFNSGVEVANDGSPVPETPMPSFLVGAPSMAQLVDPKNGHSMDIDAFLDDTRPAEAGGLPRFSTCGLYEGRLHPTTPTGVGGAENLMHEHDDEVLIHE